MLKLMPVMISDKNVFRGVIKNKEALDLAYFHA